MNCRICNEPIVLVPSAAQRAASPSNVQGWSAAHYTGLFTAHTRCALKERAAEASRLMALQNQGRRNRPC